MSGYELKKQLAVKLGAFWRVSFGSLYPCLKRLAEQGAIEVAESYHTSRKKHVYRLTDRGDLLFHELLESADVHDLEQDRFSLRLAFFRYLRPETRLDQLERRRGYLQDRLADLRASLRAARDRMDAYTLELMDHGLDEHEREIAWLDRLIAAERDANAGAVQRPRPPAGPRSPGPRSLGPRSPGPRPPGPPAAGGPEPHPPRSHGTGPPPGAARPDPPRPGRGRGGPAPAGDPGTPGPTAQVPTPRDPRLPAEIG